MYDRINGPQKLPPFAVPARIRAVPFLSSSEPCKAPSHNQLLLNQYTMDTSNDSLSTRQSFPNKKHISTSSQATLQIVLLRDILRDDSLQVRATMQQSVISKYAEALAAGAEFPPVVLAYIDGSLYLVEIAP
jgi:hypothetical protein